MKSTQSNVYLVNFFVSTVSVSIDDETEQITVGQIGDEDSFFNDEKYDFDKNNHKVFIAITEIKKGVDLIELYENIIEGLITHINENLDRLALSKDWKLGQEVIIQNISLFHTYKE